MNETPTQTTFTEFPKIPRLSRECVISEKIDGTNAQVEITDDGQFLIGSRTRYITPENDNYGFAKWATERKAELMCLGVGRHFGEWWGSGCQRGYDLPKGEKRWSLFNVIRWVAYDQQAEQIVTQDPRIVKFQEKLPQCCHLVPILYRGLFTTDACENALVSLMTNGSRASPGFKKPEGIVCWHTAANMGFKKTIEKDDAPKAMRT